jgi:hypothetical protein
MMFQTMIFPFSKRKFNNWKEIVDVVLRLRRFGVDLEVEFERVRAVPGTDSGSEPV